jgi:hypothetical protein
MQRLLNIIDKSRVSKDILKINVHSLLKLEKIIDYKERLDRDNHIINNNKRDVHANENDNNNVSVSDDDEHRDDKNDYDFDDMILSDLKNRFSQSEEKKSLLPRITSEQKQEAMKEPGKKKHNNKNNTSKFLLSLSLLLFLYLFSTFCVFDDEEDIDVANVREKVVDVVTKENTEKNCEIGKDYTYEMCEDNDKKKNEKMKKNYDDKIEEDKKMKKK